MYGQSSFTWRHGRWQRERSDRKKEESKNIYSFTAAKYASRLGCASSTEEYYDYYRKGNEKQIDDHLRN